VKPANRAGTPLISPHAHATLGYFPTKQRAHMAKRTGGPSLQIIQHAKGDAQPYGEEIKDGLIKVIKVIRDR